MAAASDVDWETCAEGHCVGARLPTGDRCWAHADDQDLDTALKRLGEDGHLDARGAVITAALLRRILATAPRNEHDRPTLTSADFQRTVFDGEATFKDMAWFDRAIFKGWTRFDGATFKVSVSFDSATFEDVWFAQATFKGTARFESATLKGSPVFIGATFEGTARFVRATFEGEASFVGATFKEIAWFEGATFDSEADFDQATFEDAWFHGATFKHAAKFFGATFKHAANFTGATFEHAANFTGATFKHAANLTGATFKHAVRFVGARFERAQQLGPILVRKQLVLDDVLFDQRVRIQAGAATVCARRARFPAGAHLQLRWAQILLDDADLAAPAILAAAPPFLHLDETRFAARWQRLPPPPRDQRDRPRLLSLRRADVAGLTLAGIDLRACRFAGAHHLDRLRIDGHPRFAPTPRGWRWAKRQTLAEEHHWRHAHGAGGWYPPPCQPPPWAEQPASPHPLEVAALYRALRKGREDDKDEPGAADFYYGEMEMRRQARALAARKAWQERELGSWAASATELAILTGYWLVSGYALRAWRALASLLVIVVLAAVGVSLWGFAAPQQPPRPVRVDSAGTIFYAQPQVGRPSGLDELPEAIRFSAESATALLRGPDRPLTLPGWTLHITLRLLGPGLLGLAVVSIRGRVKR
jgi:uncharacterized protein YjbI with pentapeptide repeats